MSIPYTHEAHARRTVVAYFKGEPLGIKATYVQAMVGRTVCCARIVTAWDTSDNVQMWQLDLLGPIFGRMSIPAARVRQCNVVDGHCVCVPHDLANEEACGAAGKRSAAAPQALPDGNHGETPPTESRP